MHGASARPFETFSEMSKRCTAPVRRGGAESKEVFHQKNYPVSFFEKSERYLLSQIPIRSLIFNDLTSFFVQTIRAIALKEVLSLLLTKFRLANTGFCSFSVTAAGTNKMLHNDLYIKLVNVLYIRFKKMKEEKCTHIAAKKRPDSFSGEKLPWTPRRRAA